MPELSAPTELWHRHAQRVEAIQRRDRMINLMLLEQRLDITALATEDTPFGLRRFVADELALALGESPWTGASLVEMAQRFAAYPIVQAKVADGTWSVRHADAVLDELAGSGLSTVDCQQVLDLVISRQAATTPHQLRGAVRAAIMLLDLEAACRRNEKIKRDRNVQAWDSKDGGAAAMVSGPKHLIAQMMASLDALIWPRQPGEERTASQRRFDALMDLICGRVVPGQWQAQLVATLATAEGDNTTLAEIPGFGTLLPSEARELIAHAGLRRVTVDPSGQLLAVDNHIARPDLNPTASPGMPAERKLSDQTEPEPIDDFAPDLNDTDRAWLTEHPCSEAEADAVAEVETSAPAEESELLPPSEADLAWLEQVAPRPGPAASAARGRPTRESSVVDEQPTPTASASASASGEQTPGTGSLAWLAQHPRASWSARALRQALTAMRTDPVVVTDLHSDSYAIPKRLKRYLMLRDLCCTFPCCARPAKHCESDHLIPWPRGSTSRTNLASECKHHHLAKHAYFTVERLPDGTLRWRTPGGITYDRPPRPLLRGW